MLYKIKTRYHIQISFFQNICFILSLCFSALLITCKVQDRTNALALQNQISKEINIDQKNTNVQFCSIANTADTVFISDIFFSLQFIPKFNYPTSPETATGLITQIIQAFFKDRLHYDVFYTEAAKRAIDASLYIVGPTTALSSQDTTNQKNRKIDQYIDNVFTQLSPIQYKRILSAKHVIVSPLAKVFAYKQIQNIMEYRKRCKKTPVKIPSRTTNGYTAQLLRLDYSLAIHALTDDIIKELQKELQMGNTLDFTVIADSAREEVVQDLKMVLKKIKTQLPQTRTRIIWKKLDPQLKDSFSIQEQVLLPNSVVLLYTGLYTAQISQEINAKKNIKKDQIFAILPWQTEPYALDSDIFTGANIKSYNIYAKEWVAMPISALFSKKDYAYAKLYRSKIMK